METKLSDFIGLVVTRVEQHPDNARLDLIFDLDHRRLRFQHIQDCCESVFLDEIVGDLNDLIGAPLVECEQVSGETVGFADPYAGKSSRYGAENFDEDAPESYTWTFYKLGTRKGSVTLRWFGNSNGYYSENVDVDEVPYEGSRQ